MFDQLLCELPDHWQQSVFIHVPFNMMILEWINDLSRSAIATIWSNELIILFPINYLTSCLTNARSSLLHGDLIQLRVNASMILNNLTCYNFYIDFRCFLTYTLSLNTIFHIHLCCVFFFFNYNDLTKWICVNKIVNVNRNINELKNIDC